MLIMMMAMLMMMFGVQGAHFAFPFFSFLREERE